jgi:hypothetical protein
MHYRSAAAATVLLQFLNYNSKSNNFLKVQELLLRHNKNTIKMLNSDIKNQKEVKIFFYKNFKHAI